MARDTFEIPDHLKALFEREIRNSIASESFFDLYELSLFQWHLKETEALHKRMHDEELAYINQQIDKDFECINDSGMIPVEYFHRRIRYADVVYLVSLLETVLEDACGRLRQVLPATSIPFDLNELKDDKWIACRKFLERYGRFDHPKKLWKPINMLIILRNAIVHDNGAVASLKAGDRDALSKCSGLIPTGENINVRLEYIEAAVSDLEELIRYYERGVSDAIRRIDQPEISQNT